MTPQEYLARSPLPNRTRWDHQIEAFTKACERTGYFYSMETRTGKTQPSLDTAGYLYANDEIRGLIIAAMPGGAPRNWRDEIDSGMLPDWIPRQVILWDVQKAAFTKDKITGKKTKPANIAYHQLLKDLLTFEGLSIILINGEATITEAFCDYAYKFMKKRPTMLVGDETTLLMKTPGAARTKALYHLGRHAKFRRCLDGTPSGEGPMDLFAQYRFLSGDIFGTEFAPFKTTYCEMVKEYSASMNKGAGGFYDTIAKDEDNQPVYRNLDKLQRIIKPHTFRVRFKDVFKDVPEPIYSKRYLQLLPKQRTTYDRLETEYEAELAGLGTVTVANVLTRYLRLQQVTAGFWPNSKAAVICERCDGEGCPTCGDLGVIEHNVPMQRLVPFADNPRIIALRDELTFSNVPTVVWARFNQDIDDCMELCRQLGRRPVQYDGRVNEDQKHANKAAFQAGDADTFVAKTRSAGRAVSTSAAENMVYYSSEFGLNQRLQSEVRPLTGTRTTAYGIIDLVAENTKDEQIIASHRARRRLSDTILNEHSGKWL